jgi:hypothetical protein
LLGALLCSHDGITHVNSARREHHAADSPNVMDERDGTERDGAAQEGARNAARIRMGGYARTGTGW